MDPKDYLIESVRGTLAFARLAILLVFAMNAIGYLDQPSKLYAFGMVLAALCAGLSYVAQSVSSSEALADGNERGSLLQLVAAVAGVLGAICFILGY